MSDKRAAMIERAQRFRRRMSGKDRGVSPVVATLILILIAVAAAAALYLWLVTWQGNITGGIGNQQVQSTLHIGGSTSVYPFDELAVTQFEQNHSDVAITNSQGGSGAGMLAVCSGAVDIGAASFPVSGSLLVSSYGCSAAVESTIVVTTVAYDAVDPIVASANTHGLLSINYDTLALIYDDATVETGASTPAFNAAFAAAGVGINGEPALAGIPTPASITYGTTTTYLEWAQIPAAVAGATIGTYTETTTGVTVGASVAACTGFPDDVCPTAGATPCGWEVCASGTSVIQTVAREDASGTTQSFEARLIDAVNNHAFGTPSDLQSAATGFSGCGSSNYISDCGFVATQVGSGNPAVIADVAANPNAIGYASDGLARAAGSGVAITPFLGVGQTANYYTADPTWYGAILATTGSSGTIALGIKSQTVSADYAIGYLGWRPFDLVTLNTPAATAAAFLSFVTDPANNQNLATESQEVSIYSV